MNNIFTYLTPQSRRRRNIKVLLVGSGFLTQVWKQCCVQSEGFSASSASSPTDFPSQGFIQSGVAVRSRRLPHLVCIFCSMKQDWNVWTGTFLCWTFCVMISGQSSPSAPSERITFDVGSLRSRMQIWSLEERLHRIVRCLTTRHENW